MLGRAAYDFPLNGFEGHVNVRGRGLRGTKVILPAWVTPNIITQELQRPRAAGEIAPERLQLLENLRAVLSRLTAAQYGRDNQLDDQVLDDALDSGLSGQSRESVMCRRRR